MYGHYHAVQVLIEAGALLDIQSVTGQTALILATTGQYCEVVKLLIEFRANVNIEDKV